METCLGGSVTGAGPLFFSVEFAAPVWWSCDQTCTVDDCVFVCVCGCGGAPVPVVLSLAIAHCPLLYSPDTHTGGSNGGVHLVCCVVGKSVKSVFLEGSSLVLQGWKLYLWLFCVGCEIIQDRTHSHTHTPWGSDRPPPTAPVVPPNA